MLLIRIIMLKAWAPVPRRHGGLRGVLPESLEAMCRKFQAQFVGTELKETVNSYSLYVKHIHPASLSE